MADSRRPSKNTFREGLAQLSQDLQEQKSKPLASDEVWESERVLEVGQTPPVDRGTPPDPLALLKSRNPVFEFVRNSVRLCGFTHPEEGNFVMLPREFEAILALENKAVAQVVLYIIRETIGWADEHGRHQRREWVQLGQKHFEIVCGSKSQGFYGVKTALQKGYIIRRPHKNSFQYSIRWKDRSEGPEE
jgi:hypothetical protein